MSKGNKSAGLFDLNRDGKMSMAEHYIAYKIFEEMSQPSSYTPRPRKEHWWNKPIHYSPLGWVLASFFVTFAFQGPFVLVQIAFIEQLQEELEKKQVYSLLYHYKCSNSETIALYVLIVITGLIQLALFCAMAYGCYDFIKQYCRYLREKRRRKNEEYEECEEYEEYEEYYDE